MLGGVGKRHMKTLPYGENNTPAKAGFGSVKSYICAAEFRSAAQMQALVSLG